MASETAVRDRAAVDWSLLFLRVIVGIVFMAHGAQKLGAFGGPGIAAIVQMMGPLGYLVTIGEFFGGLGLIAGILPRFSAASIIVIMLGAIGMVHGKVGFFMNWTGQQAGEGYEYHLLAIASLLPIVIVGPGRFAVARLFTWPRIPGLRSPAGRVDDAGCEARGRCRPPAREGESGRFGSLWAGSDAGLGARHPGSSGAYPSLIHGGSTCARSSSSPSCSPCSPPFSPRPPTIIVRARR